MIENCTKCGFQFLKNRGKYYLIFLKFWSRQTRPPYTSTYYMGIGVNYNALFATKLPDQTLHYIKSNSELGTMPGKRKLTRNGIGWNVFIGNNFNKHWGHEIGLSHYGKLSLKDSGSYVAPNNAHYKTRRDIDINNSWYLYYDLYFYVPASSYFKVFAKGGVGYYYANGKSVTDKIQEEQKFDVHTEQNIKSRALSPNCGFGLQFNKNQFGLRGSYTYLIPTTDYSEYIKNGYFALDALYQFK